MNQHSLYPLAAACVLVLAGCASPAPAPSAPAPSASARPAAPAPSGKRVTLAEFSASLKASDPAAALASDCAALTETGAADFCLAQQDRLRRERLAREQSQAYRKANDPEGKFDCSTIADEYVRTGCRDYQASVRMGTKISALATLGTDRVARLDCAAYLADASAGAGSGAVSQFRALCDANVASAKSSFTGSTVPSR